MLLLRIKTNCHWFTGIAKNLITLSILIALKSEFKTKMFVPTDFSSNFFLKTIMRLTIKACNIRKFIFLQLKILLTKLIMCTRLLTTELTLSLPSFELKGIVQEKMVKIIKFLFFAQKVSSGMGALRPKFLGG